MAASGGGLRIRASARRRAGCRGSDGESPRRIRLRAYFELFEMPERVLQHAAQFKLAFQIEEERFVVLCLTDGARQYLLGGDIELLGQRGDAVFGGTQAVACEFSFHRQGVLDQGNRLIWRGGLDLNRSHAWTPWTG